MGRPYGRPFQHVYLPEAWLLLLLPACAEGHAAIDGKQRIVLALNTRSRAKAIKYSQVICQRLDERWLPMRLDAMGLGNVLVDDVKQQTAPLLSEAVTHYLQLKGIGKAKTFHQAALRNAGVVIDQLGDRPLCDYSTVDAGKVRDALFIEGYLYYQSGVSSRL